MHGSSTVANLTDAACDSCRARKCVGRRTDGLQQAGSVALLCVQGQVLGSAAMKRCPSTHDILQGHCTMLATIRLPSVHGKTVPVAHPSSGMASTASCCACAAHLPPCAPPSPAAASPAPDSNGAAGAGTSLATTAASASICTSAGGSKTAAAAAACRSVCAAASSCVADAVASP
jgi:hypothetical protein